MRQVHDPSAREAVTQAKQGDYFSFERASTVPRTESRRGVLLEWCNAFKQVWPIYLATHGACVLLSYLVVLFQVKNFSHDQLPFSVLWSAWYRWDSGQFVSIATRGYDSPWRTAFFPLYPLLESVLGLLVSSPFIAGLIISNIVTLVLFTVLYRLLQVDFESTLAYRAVLYLAVFPTAFFLAAAYNEALFLCLVLLCFYAMRRSKWWWAGLFGLLASLTRSAGLCLLVPFCYEYLYQRRFRLSAIRADALSGLLILAGTGLFAVYCGFRFGDALAFSHVQAYWGRALTFPGIGFARAFWVILHAGVLSFSTLHSVIDLGAGLLALVLTVLCFVGPWKIPVELQAYG
ncbi:MAG: glycosyltransferase family 39 protein, partial [Ktedonobacteraceae bacterium]|nr:glycosyltransferase family 39 protein [Ktedonobacteraceae bacterium]